MSRQKRLIVFTLSFEGFELGGHIHLSVAVVTNVKWNHANGIAGNEELVLLLVVERKGKDAAEVFKEVNSLITLKCKNNLAVAARLEFVLTSIETANFLMVVDLTVHGKYLLPIWREKGLATRFWVYDTQTLVSENGAAATVDTTPVWSAVTDLLTHFQCFLTKSLCLLFYVQYCYYSTHNLSVFIVVFSVCLLYSSRKPD